MVLRGISLVALMLMASVAQAQDLASDKGKLSYAIGWDLGIDIKNRSTEVDVEAVIAAIRDAAAGNDPRVVAEEMAASLQAFNQKIQQERQAAFAQLASENQAKSNTYLNEQRGKTGVVALPSGVLYRIIEEGTGARPKLEDTIAFHYRGSKIDGREFDSSFRGDPLSMPVSQIALAGWKEVIPLMRSGATWQVFIPPELAFGARGQLPVVGPNEALTFDLKLVSVGE